MPTNGLDTESTSFSQPNAVRESIGINQSEAIPNKINTSGIDRPPMFSERLDQVSICNFSSAKD
jgi:hypothetical protein